MYYYLINLDFINLPQSFYEFYQLLDLNNLYPAYKIAEPARAANIPSFDLTPFFIIN